MFGLAAFALVLFLVAAFGLAASPAAAPKCGACRQPIPGGYAAYDEGEFLCRECAKQKGVPFWYEKYPPSLSADD